MVREVGFGPGPFRVFIHHQNGVCLSRYVKAGLLEGAGKIQQVDALDNQGGIDAVLSEMVLEVSDALFKFRLRGC